MIFRAVVGDAAERPKPLIPRVRGPRLCEMDVHRDEAVQATGSVALSQPDALRPAASGGRPRDVPYAAAMSSSEPPRRGRSIIYLASGESGALQALHRLEARVDMGPGGACGGGCSTLKGGSWRTEGNKERIFSSIRTDRHPLRSVGQCRTPGPIRVFICSRWSPPVWGGARRHQGDDSLLSECALPVLPAQKCPSGDAWSQWGSHDLAGSRRVGLKHGLGRPGGTVRSRPVLGGAR